MPKHYLQSGRLNVLSLMSLVLIPFVSVACKPASAFWPFKKHHHEEDNLPTEVTEPVAPSPSSPVYNQPIRYYPANGQQQPDIVKPRPRSTQPSQSQLTTTCPIPIPANSHLIRVALGLNTKTSEIHTSCSARVISALDGKVVAYLAKPSHWQISADNQALVLQMRNCGIKEKTIAKARETYLDSYHSQDNFNSVGSYGNSRPAISQTKHPVYLPAYLPAENSTSETGKLQSLAYVPRSAPPVQTEVPRYLKLPISPVTGKAGWPIQNGNTSLASSYFIVPDRSATGEASIGYNNKSYKGCLCLTAQSQSGSLNIINYLDIEDYLLSVVPSEMPSSWPFEALKAQAIAARSYAMANLGKHAIDGYDVKDTTEDQVYTGANSETKSSNQAVFDSKGLVLTYNGKPVCAYFHSTSGGSTELAENIWSKPLPYLKSVIGQDQLSPHYSWSYKFSVDEIERKIVPDAGKLLSILVIARTPTQRATYLLFISSNNARILPAETVRRSLNLPSSNFNVTSSDQAYTFDGHGFGHGLGLSQWGAKALAEQGYNAEQILKYYYKDVTVEQPADVFGS